MRVQCEVEGRTRDFGGDLRIGDLTGDGRVDFLVTRAFAEGPQGGGLKPCFHGALTLDGEPLWSVGKAGGQPLRPGPTAIHDIDGDGAAEVVSLFATGADAPPEVMTNVVAQIRAGATGELIHEAAPPALHACQGSGPNWVHQRLLVANLRGTATPQDLVIKLGSRLLAFDNRFDLLWAYDIAWNEYGHCAAYIPAVGDIDGDGRDEVNGGYFLLDDDATPLWEARLAPHMDSVAIVPWDRGQMRAVCSGGGHVMDAAGRAVLALGTDRVPHGQEARVARFEPDDRDPQMVIRWHGHHPDVIVVNTAGDVAHSFCLNDSPNHTGMEVVAWRGPAAPWALYNGGMLWDPLAATGVHLPGLPEPVGPARMGWYHVIPADICGDNCEELVLFNPWDRWVWVYTPAPLDPDAYSGYRPGPRQINARLMD